MHKYVEESAQLCMRAETRSKMSKWSQIEKKAVADHIIKT